MVSQTSGSSPKKRRTDDGTRTAQQIADTNQTLQMFTAHASRQNRWMMQNMNAGVSAAENGANGAGARGSSATQAGTTENDGNNVSVSTLRHGHGHVNVNEDILRHGHVNVNEDILRHGHVNVNEDMLRRAAGLDRSTPAIASLPNVHARPSAPPSLHLNTAPPSVHLNTAPVPGRASNAASGPGLVDDESPYAVQMPTPLTTAAALHSRPSSVSMSRPGLPSPAPSEENANSPTNAITIPDDPNPDPNARFSAQQRVSGRTGRPRGRPRKFPPGSSVSNRPSAASPNMHMLPQPFVPSTPSSFPASARPRVPTPTSNLAPPAMRANSVAYAANTMPNASPQQQNMQTSIPQSPTASTALYDKASSLQRLNDFSRHQHRTLNHVDQGRMTLLSEAIQKEDIFYLVLSQVFSLVGLQQGLVPQQLQRVSAAAWSALENLLCSNQQLTEPARRWLAEFPAPIHIIATSGESRMFDNHLILIESFLQELPRQWPNLLELSRRRLAPPLTQELNELLYLISPVMQTTAFRAIARAIWEDNNPGLQVLLSLHEIDRDTYNRQGWKRNEVERRAAHGIYTRLYHAYKLWISHAGNRPEDFLPPEECILFKRIPESMGRAVDDQGRVSQTAAQQRQVMEANQRVLNQRGQALPMQQQQMLHTSNRMIAQGQGLVHDPASPGFHPPVQQRPGPRYNTHTVQPRAPSPPPPQPVPAHLMLRSILPTSAAPAHLARFLPPANAPPRPMPVQPDTIRMSLHQAHLRSPLPSPKKLSPDQQPMYRHVIGYALSPAPLSTSLCVQTFSISLAQAHFDKIPSIALPKPPGDPGIRTLIEGSILYRLRCAKIPPSSKFDTEDSWVTAENVWPDSVSFELNNKYLEPKRKLHHGRYLPIDLSPHLQAGPNTLTVYSLPGRPETAYAIAVEEIGTTAHSTILAAIPTIPSATSLAAIKLSLASPTDEDDDIAMTSSTLTIPLFDPYRADRICAIPVRGGSCLHRDCFDLETFLSQCKREQPGWPCVPDCWRCPICKGDVRPQTLVKDGFLIEVRRELERRGALATRAVVVDERGGWKPKVEAVARGVRSASLEREEAAAAVELAAGRGKRKAVEVIELD